MPLVAVMAATACTHTETPIRVIEADTAAAQTVEVDTTAMLRLEASDSSLIYGIDRLVPVGDVYVVASRNLLRSFSRADGRYAGDIAVAGPREQDFSDISGVWNRDDTLILFDCNARSIASYLPDGSFLGKRYPLADTEIARDQPPRLYFDINGGALTVNGSTGGSTPSNPKLTYYDLARHKAQPVKGREVRESTYLADGAFYDAPKEELLLWEPFNDTIFAATPKGIVPTYTVDFGSQSLPSEIQNIKGVAGRLAAFKEAAPGRYASLLRYVQTDGDDIYFCFACNDGRNYVARADAAGGKATVRSFRSAGGRYSQTTFFLLDGDSLRIELRDNDSVEANPIIYSVHKKEML